MNQPLNIKIRLLAACCHLSGLSWVAIFSSTLLDIFFSALLDPQSSLASEIVRFTSLLTPLLFCVPFIICLLTRNIHDFVYRSGLKALNYYFSIILYGICWQILMLIGLGIALFYALPNLGNIGTSAPGTTAPDEVKFLLSIFDRLFWVASNPQYLLLAHTLNISIAAFFTAGGKVFSYPLTIPFFRSANLSK